MATQLCDIDGVRPAVATVRIRENGRVVTRNLCEEHLAEVQGRTSPLGGRSLFDEFFSDFFDGFGGGRPAGGRVGAATAPRRGIEQTDITEYFSDATRSLLHVALTVVLVDSTGLALLRWWSRIQGMVRFPRCGYGSNVHAIRG